MLSGKYEQLAGQLSRAAAGVVNLLQFVFDPCGKLRMANQG